MNDAHDILPDPDEPFRSEGRLAHNIMHFGRVLRAAGLPVGPGKVIDAVRAAEVVGVERRDDFYWALFSVFVNRQDHVELFDQAFHVFWRNPRLLDRLRSMLLPSVEVEEPPQPDRGREMARRLAEALNQGRVEGKKEREEQLEFDATLTFSEREQLQEMDFEKMSGAEMAEAKAALQHLRLPIVELPTRRTRPDAHGRRIDMRASLRAALRSADAIPLRRRSRRRRHPPLVVICDISGSMSRYSRMFLHFLHAITNDRDRVHTFLFGTRLTNITRHLRHRDVDVALERVTDSVVDWSGGTRIGQCLKDFNAGWSRRVLGQGAVVLLISDGLDRDAGHGLAAEAQRLHMSCRRLIWLNPLLRFEGFQPKSKGVQAILPHVDDFRTIHNLASMYDLADVLSREQPRRLAARHAIGEAA